MNSVSLIGNLVKDVELLTSNSGITFAKFILAVNSGFGDSKRADFVSCVAFGKTAEALVNYTTKGSKISVLGRIRTGKYEKDGRTVYTTDILVDQLYFLNKKLNNYENTHNNYDEDIPF